MCSLDNIYITELLSIDITIWIVHILKKQQLFYKTGQVMLKVS